ncbi:tyrosine-type recombinase/integrase [Terrabacter lapilli]|uniref:Tyrosine-type recombinase/integrase n=1 Tax=Terrabacter lapilli TaxID=436231 RepID=A0ABN2RHQ1_9MICO
MSDAELTVPDLRELAESWAVSLRASGKSRETIRVYLRNVGQFLTFCESVDLAPMSRRTMDAFLADLLDRGREGSTARGRLTAVKQFTKWLASVNELDVDPFLGVAPPTMDTKLVHPLSDEQIRGLLATCRTPKGATRERQFLDVRDEALIRLMVETGLRAGEVLALTVDDVHWTADPPFVEVHKSKARRGRRAPFSAQAAVAIGAYVRARRRQSLASSPSFWLGARRNVLAYAGLYDALERRALAAGIEGFHPHRMRHTAAHRWLAAGGSEGGLMSVAGWSRPDMLMRYTRARAEQRAAEEAARLNLGEL